MAVCVIPAPPFVTPTREWVRFENGIATVGISASILEDLGDIVALELPEIGKILVSGQSAAVLESSKTCRDVYSPVSGTVTAVHTALQHDLHPLNRDPQATWLLRIRQDVPVLPDAAHPIPR